MSACEHSYEHQPDLWSKDEVVFEDIAHYKRLVSKLIYLIVTMPHITFVVELVNQFMHKPKEVHWKTALRILAHIKGSSGKALLYKENGHLRIKAYPYSGYAGDEGGRKSASGYYNYVGGILMI